MRRFFSGLAAASLLIAGLIFLVIYKQVIDIPEEHTVKVIAAIPAFVLLSVICLYISSSLRRRETRTDDFPTGEMPAVQSRAQAAPQESPRNDVYAVTQLHELKGKLIGIVGRVIAAVLLTLLLGTGHIIAFLGFYIIVSYCWMFIKATRNYFIGIIAFIGTVFLVLTKIENSLPQQQQNILLAVLIFGVFVIDLINIIRYIRLSAQMHR